MALWEIQDFHGWPCPARIGSKRKMPDITFHQNFSSWWQGCFVGMHISLISVHHHHCIHINFIKVRTNNFEEKIDIKHLDVNLISYGSILTIDKGPRHSILWNFTSQLTLNLIQVQSLSVTLYEMLVIISLHNPLWVFSLHFCP